MLFSYTITEDVVSPESAEDGDFESSEVVVEDEAPLRDLVTMCRRRGIEHVQTTWNGLSIRHFSDTNYHNGHESTETTFIICSPRNALRFQRFLNKKRG